MSSNVSGSCSILGTSYSTELCQTEHVRDDEVPGRYGSKVSKYSVLTNLEPPTNNQMSRERTPALYIALASCFEILMSSTSDDT